MEHWWPHFDMDNVKIALRCQKCINRAGQAGSFEFRCPLARSSFIPEQTFASFAHANTLWRDENDLVPNRLFNIMILKLEKVFFFFLWLIIEIASGIGSVAFPFIILGDHSTASSMDIAATNNGPFSINPFSTL